MSGKKNQGGDKRTQWWTSIDKEKLDAVRWIMLHSGLNVGSLQDDEGRTGLQIAAAGDKHKALLVILDLLRQKRELSTTIDVPDEEKGMTPLMIAASKGHAKSVDHLLYYGASQTMKSAAGKTAYDYAVASKREDVISVFVDHNTKPEEDTGAGVETGLDEDGLTSTQRNRLKKKQMAEDSRKAMINAVNAAASARGDEAPPEDEDEEGAVGGGAGGGGGGSTTTSSSSSGTASNSSSATAAASNGMPPLVPAGTAPVWPELIAVLAEKRREMKVDRVSTSAASTASIASKTTTSNTSTVGDDGNDADTSVSNAAGAGAGGVEGEVETSDATEASSAATVTTTSGGEVDPVDPVVYRTGVLNRLELRLPNWTVLSPSIGYLTSLQTLIVKNNAITSIPDTIGLLTDLKFLDISHNALTTLPPAAIMKKLTKLEVLDFSKNSITSLEPISTLSSFLTLKADYNGITEITLNFAGLARLDTLTLSKNAITSIPDEIGELQALAVLNVADNAITELPAGMAELKEKKIRELIILPNPIADKKVLKVLNKDRVTEVVKELWKLLASSGGGGGKKGGGKGKK